MRRKRLPRRGPSESRPPPLSVRLLGAGVRGAREVGKATGVDRAVEAAAEEAMVAAVESEAVERALVRVLKGPVVEEAVNSALESETVKQALIDALDSEMVDEVWLRLLASDETQRLVERIAEAPEIRAAISAQSVGFIEDIGRTIGDAHQARSTASLERHRAADLLPHARTEPTDRAGAVTRALAFGLDVLIVNLAFSGAGGDRGAGRLRLHRHATASRTSPSHSGTTAWLALLPLPLRLLVARRPDAGNAIPRDQARRRRPGSAARALDPPAGRPRARRAVPFGHRLPRHPLRRTAAGLAGPPRRASTSSTRPARARALGAARSYRDGDADAASETTKAPDSRGLRPQQVAGP